MKKGRRIVLMMLIAAICVFAAACGSDKHTHTYGETWEITTEPTETTGGKAKRTCTECNEEEEVDIPALTDTTVWTEDTASAVPATHTTTGSRKYTSVYGAVTVTVPTVPHVYTGATWTVLTQPTKTTEGKAKATCVECHNDSEIVLPVLTDKVWRGYGVTAATCTEDGEQRYIADKLYGIVVREPIASPGHTWDDEKYTALAIDNIVFGRVCSVCGRAEGDRKEALSDTDAWTRGTSITADYNTAGYDVYTRRTEPAIGAVVKLKTANKLPTANDGKQYYTLEAVYNNGTASIGTSYNASPMYTDGDSNNVVKPAYPYSGNAKLNMTAASGAFTVDIGSSRHNAYIDATGSVIVYVNGDRLFISIIDNHQVEEIVNEEVVGWKTVADDSKLTVSAWKIGGVTYTAVAYTGTNAAKFFVAGNTIYANVQFTDMAGANLDVATLAAQPCVYVMQDTTRVGAFGYNGTQTVELDGLEGTYTKDSETLTVSGFGTVTFNGSNGIYVRNADNENVIDAIVNGTASYAFTLDTTAKTFTKETTTVEIELVIEGSESVKLTGGKHITTELPANPAIPSDKVFRGWYTQANGQGAKVTDVTPENTDKITLYAFLRNKVTVQYVDEDNATQTLVLGEGDTYFDYLPDYGVQVARNRYLAHWYIGSEDNTLDSDTLVGTSDNGSIVRPVWEELPAYYGTYYGVQMNGSGYASFESWQDVVEIDERKQVNFYEIRVSSGSKSTKFSGTVVDNEAGAPSQMLTVRTSSGSLYYLWYDNATGVMILSTFANDKDLKYNSFVVVKGATAASNPIQDMHKFKYNAGISYTSNGLTTYVRVVTANGVKDIVLYNDGQLHNKIFNNVQISDALGTVFADETDSKIVDKIKAAKTLVVKDKTANTIVFAIGTSADNFGVSSGTITSLQEPYGSFAANGKTVVLNGMGVASYDGKTGTYSKDAANEYVDIYLAEDTEYWRLTIGDTNTMVQPITTVTFDPQGGTLAGGNTRQYNTNIAVTLPTPTRENFVFRGWFTDSACQNAVELTEEKFIPTEDDTFYAKWVQAGTLTIVYNNGTPNGSEKYGIGETFTVANPTKTGKAFGGWYTTENFAEGSEWTSGETVLTGTTTTIYAKWNDKLPYNNNYTFIEVEALSSGSNRLTAFATKRINIDENGQAPSAGQWPFNQAIQISNYNSTTGSLEFQIGTTTARRAYVDSVSGILVVERTANSAKFNDVYILVPVVDESDVVSGNISGSNWNEQATIAVTCTYGGNTVNIFIHNSVVYFGVTFEDDSGAPVAAADCAANTATLVVKDASGNPINFAA